MTTPYRVQLARAEVARHLGQLERIFKPGVKLTFLMRDPENPECDLLITADTLDGIAAAVERSRGREDVRT